jgi:hypothetical protein
MTSTRDIIELVFDQFLLIYIVATVILTGLLLGWETPIGRALARYKMAFALIFIGAFLGNWFSVFMSDPWRWFLRVIVAITVSGVIWEFRQRYGGWKAMNRYAWINLRQWPELFRRHSSDEGSG